MCVTVAVSSVELSSSSAETVTVCASSQSVVENVRLTRSCFTSSLSIGSLMLTVTVSVGSVSSTTVYVFVPPSSTVSEVGVNVTPRVSLSLTVTSKLPVTETYSPPLAMCSRVTVSASSSILSSTAVTVTVCALFQLAAVNMRGNPEVVTSGLDGLEIPTVTSSVGIVFSFTEYVLMLPSVIVRDVGEKVMPGVSSSVTVTSTLDTVTPP